MTTPPRVTGRVQRAILEQLAAMSPRAIGMVGSNSTSTNNALDALREAGLIAHVADAPRTTLYGTWQLTNAGRIAVGAMNGDQVVADPSQGDTP